MSEIQEAMDWLNGGDTGSSSKAIMSVMLGGAKKSLDYPHDPADLGRCLRLLRRIPAWKDRLGDMAECGPAWESLIAIWPEIEASMLDEVGINWEKSRSAPKTYRLMRSVLDEVVWK